MEHNCKRRAVVTGASSGLGSCFALELASRGIDTILISLANTGLEQICEECRNAGTESTFFEADLTDKSQLLELCKRITSEYDIFMLINNAGTGGTRSFMNCSTGYLENIIKLNVFATTMMTHELLPALRKAPQAYILNVSSMAAFSPIGFKTVYPASKRFIHDFTIGLHEELRSTNIFAGVIHPGPMKTNRDVTRRIEKQGAFGHIGLLSPEEVARKGIKHLLHKDMVILPGWSNKLNRLVMKFVPSRIRVPIISKVVSRELKEQA